MGNSYDYVFQSKKNEEAGKLTEDIMHVLRGLSSVICYAPQDDWEFYKLELADKVQYFSDRNPDFKDNHDFIVAKALQHDFKIQVTELCLKEGKEIEDFPLKVYCPRFNRNQIVPH